MSSIIIAGAAAQAVTYYSPIGVSSSYLAGLTGLGMVVPRYLFASRESQVGAEIYMPPLFYLIGSAFMGADLTSARPYIDAVAVGLLTIVLRNGFAVFV